MAGIKKITIDEEVYVRLSDVGARKYEPVMDGNGVTTFCIVRCDRSGVFAGWVNMGEIADKVLRIFNSRRIWYWAGAASLSQLSQEGTKEPDNCKFPCEVPMTVVTDVIEVIPCTKEAKDSILGVSVWER